MWVRAENGAADADPQASVYGGVILTSRRGEYRSAVADAADVLCGCSDRSTGPVRPRGGRILAHAPPSNPDAAWDAVLDAMEEGRAPHLTAVTANPLGLWLVCSTVYIDDRRPPALAQGC
ncbi:hypothetical protein GCM10009609_65330 [Pseudonocardia aurantiaca]|uniref:Uncharacterized protein n=1 Tax=Pseudonocardia aurantiaca TaxID=75290 RepID=A0ABW4FT24_9PSEU